LLILVLADFALKKFRYGLRSFALPDVANVELIEDELNDKLQGEKNKKDADDKIGHRGGMRIEQPRDAAAR
jgi:hypothetical protein